jgi:chromosome segregation ATPase
MLTRFFYFTKAVESAEKEHSLAIGRIQELKDDIKAANVLKEKVEQDAASVIAGYTRMQAEMEVAEKALGDAESDRSKYSSAISEMQARHTSMTKNMKLRHEKLLQAIAKAKKEKKVLVQEVRNLRERTSSIGM